MRLVREYLVGHQHRIAVLDALRPLGVEVDA